MLRLSYLFISIPLQSCFTGLVRNVTIYQSAAIVVKITMQGNCSKTLKLKESKEDRERGYTHKTSVSHN